MLCVQIVYMFVDFLFISCFKRDYVNLLFDLLVSRYIINYADFHFVVTR